MRFIKKKIYLISFILLVLIILLFLVTKNKLENNSSSNLVINKEELVSNDDKKENNEVLECKFIYVDIKGEVINPGVYEVTEEDRVIDVINKASGLTANADTSLINLSKKVTDEMVIIVYKKEDIKDKEIVKVIEKECVCPDVFNDASISNDSYVSEVNDKINIKNVTKDELLSVPGIGEIKATAIMDYKNKYGFNKVEDLLEVNGIGSQTYEKIKIYFKS